MTTKTAPAYTRFCANLAARYLALGIPVIASSDQDKDGWRGPDGWVNFETEGSGDKLYAKRTKGGDPTVIETTVPFDLIPPSLIVKDMRGLNGKIEARVKPDVDLIASELLPIIASRRAAGDKLRASKTPVRGASQASSAPALVASERAELDALRTEQAALKARLEREEAARLAADEANTLRA